MKESTAAKKAQAKLFELLAKAGVEEEKLTALKENAEIRETDFVRTLEAEGILLSLFSTKLPIKVKECKWCGEPFGTNYVYVAYCKDTCRAKALAEIGIQWNPLKAPEERWGTELLRKQIPIVVSPEAIQNLKNLLVEVEKIEGKRTQIPLNLDPETLPDNDLPGQWTGSDFLGGPPDLVRGSEGEQIDPQPILLENTSPPSSPPEYIAPEQTPGSVFRFL